MVGVFHYHIVIVLFYVYQDIVFRLGNHLDNLFWKDQFCRNIMQFSLKIWEVNKHAMFLNGFNLDSWLLYTHYRGSYFLRYKIKITIHKTITTQIRPVKLLITNNIRIGIIHLWIKGYLFNIFSLDRRISFETTCLAMVQNLPVNSKRLCNALRINGGTRKSK